MVPIQRGRKPITTETSDTLEIVSDHSTIF